MQVARQQARLGGPSLVHASMGAACFARYLDTHQYTNSKEHGMPHHPPFLALSGAEAACTRVLKLAARCDGAGCPSLASGGPLATTPVTLDAVGPGSRAGRLLDMASRCSPCTLLAFIRDSTCRSFRCTRQRIGQPPGG